MRIVLSRRAYICRKNMFLAVIGGCDCDEISTRLMGGGGGGARRIAVTERSSPGEGNELRSEMERINRRVVAGGFVGNPVTGNQR